MKILSFDFGWGAVLLAILLALLAAVTQSGCASDDNTSTLSYLERGGFEGDIDVDTDKPPLAFGIMTRWWVGPEVHVRAKGRVKYLRPKVAAATTQPSGAAALTPPPPPRSSGEN